jgi:hypothetical protein
MGALFQTMGLEVSESKLASLDTSKHSIVRHADDVGRIRELLKIAETECPPRETLKEYKSQRAGLCITALPLTRHAFFDKNKIALRENKVKKLNEDELDMPHKPIEGKFELHARLVLLRTCFVAIGFGGKGVMDAYVIAVEGEIEDREGFDDIGLAIRAELICRAKLMSAAIYDIAHIDKIDEDTPKAIADASFLSRSNFNFDEKEVRRAMQGSPDKAKNTNKVSGNQGSGSGNSQSNRNGGKSDWDAFSSGVNNQSNRYGGESDWDSSNSGGKKGKGKKGKKGKDGGKFGSAPYQPHADAGQHHLRQQHYPQQQHFPPQEQYFSYPPLAATPAVGQSWPQTGNGNFPPAPPASGSPPATPPAPAVANKGTGDKGKGGGDKGKGSEHAPLVWKECRDWCSQAGCWRGNGCRFMHTL